MIVTKAHVIIRAMSSSDISGIVKIHLHSFPNSRSTKLGVPFLKKMYKWFLLNQPQLALVAELDQEVVGFVSGAIGGSSRKIFRYALLEILVSFVYNPQLILQSEMFELWHSYLYSLLPMSKRQNSQSRQDENTVKATLGSIAVNQSIRGQNIGKSLVQAFENAAQQQGATILMLGVETENIVARRLYENCGWVLMHEDPTQGSVNYCKKIERV